MDNTSLGDRMKFYEGRYTNDVLMPMIPVMARMDGRSFSKFTSDLERPYDKRLSDLMVETTKFLVQNTNARCGYTQSDEITLVFMQDSMESEIFFGGKLFKMLSILASTTSVFFNRNLHRFLPDHVGKTPLFDARVWNVPLEYEATNCFIWREMDATRNSISMAAQSMYSHKELQGKSSSEMQEMIFQKGRNWNDYPNFFKRGTYVRRKEVIKDLTEEEKSRIPVAFREAAAQKVRKVIEVEYDLPPLKRIANREDVIFRGANPVLKTENSNADDSEA